MSGNHVIIGLVATFIGHFLATLAWGQCGNDMNIVTWDMEQACIGYYIQFIMTMYSSFYVGRGSNN